MCIQWECCFYFSFFGNGQMTRAWRETQVIHNMYISATNTVFGNSPCTCQSAEANVFTWRLVRLWFPSFSYLCVSFEWRWTADRVYEVVLRKIGDCFWMRKKPTFLHTWTIARTACELLVFAFVGAVVPFPTLKLIAAFFYSCFFLFIFTIIISVLVHR